MDLYAIFRRSGWAPDELEEATARSRAEMQRRREELRWIRSYVLDEPDGRVGTVCYYQATSEEAIRAHARGAGLPITEIVKVAAIVVQNPDPDLNPRRAPEATPSGRPG